jgi:hypothetical protein
VKDFVGGFLQLPSGQYTDDANSLASLDPAAPVGRLPSVYMTRKSPVLRGSTNELSGWGAELTYDRALGRWLPVSPASVSPDGARYAYVDAVVTDPLPASRVQSSTWQLAPTTLSSSPGRAWLG